MTYQFNESQLKWLEALESGEYTQADGKLFDGEGYCCLGVACLVAGIKFQSVDGFYSAEGRHADLPPSLLSKFKLRTTCGDFCPGPARQIGHVRFNSLTTANDRGATFPQIAAFIRSNPTAVFTE